GFELAILLRHSKNSFGVVVTKNINAIEKRLFFASVNIAAGYGVAVLPFVGEQRRNVRRSFFAILIGESFETFVDVPAVVFAATNKIDFLHAVLANVGNPEIPIPRVKAESPGIAK